MQGVTCIRPSGCRSTDVNRTSGSLSTICKPRSCATQSCRADGLLRLCFDKRQSISILESQLHSASLQSWKPDIDIVPPCRLGETKQMRFVSEEGTTQIAKLCNHNSVIAAKSSFQRSETSTSWKACSLCTCIMHIVAERDEIYLLVHV